MQLCSTVRPRDGPVPVQARRDRAEVRPVHDRLLEPRPERLRAVRLQHRLRRRRLVRPGDGAVRVPAGRHRAELRPLSGQVRTLGTTVHVWSRQVYNGSL